MLGDAVRSLFFVLVGFGLGCAIIYVGGGEPPLPNAPVSMAALGPQMLRPSRAQFLQPAPASARYMVQPPQAMPERSTEGAVASERRQVLNAIVAAAAASAARGASALSPVDLKDSRDFQKKGGEIIYEARDLDLPQNVRDGLTAARSSIDDTKKRAAQSKKEIQERIPPLVKKAYWTEAKEQLRRQVGTLRFDLNTLAESSGKANKKAALAVNRKFITDVEECDFAIRKKQLEIAVKACDKAIASLDVALENYKATADSTVLKATNYK